MKLVLVIEAKDKMEAARLAREINLNTTANLVSAGLCTDVAKLREAVTDLGVTEANDRARQIMSLCMN